MKTKNTRSLDLSALEFLDKGKRHAYLGAVDQLRALGIGEDLSLPQLVVVGDQSSGKSSLLEGLTGLSFPVASDLCTRYATQIILRRAPKHEESVRVSILPGLSKINDAEAIKTLEKFSRIFQHAEFSSNEFVRVLDEASEFMGLPGPNETELENLTKRFSDDVLRLELSGPEYHHLSVVDVPGLFHNPTIFQTKEDLDIIRQLISKYISDPRTIILAVMDARNNLANQEVFQMARAVDPRGDRTVGIITKCDVVQSGDENGVIRIAQNGVENLQHGWFAVRNRSPSDIKGGMTIDQRHTKEAEFFASNPWDQLRKDRVGIAALGSFLAQLLYEHIRREFPSLVVEIETQCAKVQAEIELLGPPRQSTVEQRQYLTHVATKYQKQVAETLKGIYDADWTPDHPLKLRMHVRTHNDQFERHMTRTGHSKAFRMTDDSADPEYALEDSKVANIYDWIRATYLESRGSELPGTVNPAVIEHLFRQQTSKWHSIANTYLDAVVAAIRLFISAIMNVLVIDPTVRDNLESRLVPHFKSAIERAQVLLKTTLDDERNEILQTVNHYFADNLMKAREERVLSRLQRLGIEDGENFCVDLRALTTAAHLSNEAQAINDIHDILKAYYQVAVKRFMDQVVNGVVERSLLGSSGFVIKFDAHFVSNMSDEDLAATAGENYGTTSSRSELKEKLRRFEEGLRIAKSV